MKTFIETKRLILRGIMPDDIEGIFRLDSDPLVLNYIAQEPILGLDQAQDIISFIRQQYIDNGIGRWAVIEKDTKHFVGWAGFKFITTPVNHKIHYYDLGYRLIRDYWGKGYASEIATACVTYGSQNLLLEDIYAIADIENTASIRVLEKTGFKKIEQFIYEGKQHYWFRLSQSEWLYK